MSDFAKVFEWELEWIRSFVWVGGGWLADVEGDLEKPVIHTYYSNSVVELYVNISNLI